MTVPGPELDEHGEPRPETTRPTFVTTQDDSTDDTTDDEGDDA